MRSSHETAIVTRQYLDEDSICFDFVANWSAEKLTVMQDCLKWLKLNSSHHQN